MTAGRGQRIGLAALLAGSVGLAIGPILVRLSDLGPSATAFYRLAFALPLLFLWMSFEAGGEASPYRRPQGADVWRLALAGLFFAADIGVWHWSIRLTSVANATLFANLTPIFVTLGAWLLLRERITFGFVIGLGLALVGAALMIGASFGLGPRQVLGDGLGILAAFFYGGYMLIVKQLRGAFSTATVMAWSGAVSCAALLPVAVASNESLIATGLYGWSILIALGLVSHVFGQGLITYALAHLPASFTSVGLLSQPPIAALLAWIVLAEPLGPLQAAGGAAVLAGILVARRASLEARSPAPSAGAGS